MMTGLIDRLLSRYRDADYVIQLKARFLLQVCLAAVIIIPVLLVYTGYIQLINPVYGYRLHFPVLAPTAAAFVIIVAITLILIRGRFTAAAHLLFITVQVVVWSVMFIDRSNPVARLDTIIILIALLSMSPLVFSRFSLLMPLYSVATFLIFCWYVTAHASDMLLTRAEIVDLVADTGAAAVISAIISYNLFSVNRHALAHSEESRNRLKAVNEELEAANEELHSTNEELEAAMEELTATNEEFEAQNRELVESQEIISESLEEKIVLIKEVHHRVKNNMQIVSSLLNLQAQSIDDPRIQQPINDAVSRIHSMALIHEKIYRADNFTRINMSAYINDLAREILQLYSSPPGEIRVNVALDPIHLSVDQAVPCGILINEMLTNSIKHGCLDEGVCSIDIGMSRSDDMITLSIADSGPGIKREILDRGSRTTMGMQIIEALAQQLNAELDVNVDSGTRFTIRFMEKPA